MLEKSTVLLTAFLLTVIAATAQSGGYAIASIGSLDKVAALPPDTQPLTPEAYATALAPIDVAPGLPVATASFAFHRHASSVLLHLKKDHNQVTLQVINAVGNTVQFSSEENLPGGFYELPVLDPWLPSGIYMVKMVINEHVSTFQAVR